MVALFGRMIFIPSSHGCLILQSRSDRPKPYKNDIYFNVQYVYQHSDTAFNGMGNSLCYNNNILL